MKPRYPNHDSMTIDDYKEQLVIGYCLREWF